MDPYKVLGVRRGASQQEIKRAYHEQVKKYHPDQYKDNPLSELAQEKLKEINEAYAMLTEGRSEGSSSSGAAYANDGYDANAGSPEFAQVRQAISSGQYAQAQLLLERMQERPAEWYYLYGILFMRQGWYDRARDAFNTACNMEPNNSQYRTAAASLNNMGQNYSHRYETQRGAGGGNVCDMCTCMLCSDCCCECMGGDLISCC
ncbi:molecular chaperone DnaJ [Bacteroidia bacterium]|nr:molecular chaperone DnaJ [Bacteroidia bacterium]